VKRNGIHHKRSGERPGELESEPSGAQVLSGTGASRERAGALHNESRSRQDHSRDTAAQRTAHSRARLVKMVCAGGALLGFPADLAASPGESPPEGKSEAKAGRARLVHQQRGMFGLVVVT